ncbi:hypothetical protein KSP39_PZI018084 [Platanthera zijinensis]|uniref:CRIB domain-containing protein n=1 Tax=Platanthera zijinensis TaxID=2320716 RepID=A0AAP0B3J6_9ASPA
MAGVVLVLRGCRDDEERGRKMSRGDEQMERDRQLSVLALLVAAIRKSVVACRAVERRGGEAAPAVALAHMEIGWPTDVQHVSHVTFDRFHGFVGLPVEFEVEIPGRVPSARANSPGGDYGQMPPLPGEFLEKVANSPGGGV